MPLKTYGVLIARAVDTRREGASDSPHYQIHAADESGTHYRISVNVLSQERPSELLYLVDDDFQHPVTTRLTGLTGGWNKLPAGPGGPNLDFIRGNLFDPATMKTLPPEVSGPDNDLADLLDHYVRRAVETEGARLHVFGERWGPETGVADKVFGFLPGNGVHDIHMNQGNSKRFQKDDGVWQDGGLLIHFPDGTGEAGKDRWVGIFLAFQSQAWHTDDVTGHALKDTDGTRPEPGTQPVRIVGALVNPRGPAPEPEQVTLLNASPAPVDLTGWHLVDRVGNTTPVPPGPITAGAALQVPLQGGAQLPNNGGEITLLDAKGLKVHGVSYTSAQAAQEGWTVVF
ncbi:DUF2278 family protein [Streptomyces acidiscabies]|uniref:DUF2278 family protein n=1 Tax=Streptomyces acidiscabies TaxID=42234 RepID=A0AAP6EFM4_9ACTN|nr:DUF2278 family protein [Streptomyces acidiscabies]MBP5936066.1 DUF2278 family protein [Streptomyces sp. LBUM 1476]MBZ3916004.1 DUF2278 family protein [Streptomyces acidiscabies]MDX2960396.1 DUF2278 family protein [Streptomyces acidiscabies]MDX3023820.1 DUF2278 family protein [Streptomyces acidiscabies]MDX3794389.1 DUF2278 family protein [Streptomyces acidiscabies]